MANGKTGSTHEIFEKCTLILNKNGFQVDLVPMKIGRFDFIIDMDCLSPPQSCWITMLQESCMNSLTRQKTPVFYGDKSGKNLKLISCTKAQKYVLKKCYTFLAHVEYNRSKMKEINDIPHICDFPNVFPDDLPGISPNQQVKFLVYLI